MSQIIDRLLAGSKREIPDQANSGNNLQNKRSDQRRTQTKFAGSGLLDGHDERTIVTETSQTSNNALF
jgi:hypothetical protein